MSGPFVGPVGGGAANPSEVSLLDSANLLSACGGSETFLRKICDLLSRMLPVELDRAALALRAGSAKGVRHIAHQLCGMLAAFSTVAAALASELEEAAACQDLELANEQLTKLRSMTHEIVRQVGTVSLEALVRIEAESRDRSPEGG